ncbi:MAG: caspase family protein [Pyrinomonadaceae bacterium]|nr:caspase family protein [Pyrinomonadaceae bacterium]
MRILLVRYAPIATLLFTFALAIFPAPCMAQRDGRGLGLGSGTALRELPAKAKRYALVIGVDKYADTQITTLGGASNDAKLLVEALVKYAGFPREQVVLLASDQPAERQPTRGNILRRLSNLSTIVPPDGLLLFAFAGHGMERGGQAFLLPGDAQVSDDVSLLEQTAVNVTQIRNWVQRSKVKQVLLILDACRNDPSGRANADNPLTATYTRSFNFDTRNREVTAFATLYATAVGKRAYEFKEKRHGYFTWALVEGLRGGAANEKGEVTLGSLVRYLQNWVPRQVLIDLGQGKEQRPFAVIEGYKADELVIAATRNGRATTDNTTTSQISAETASVTTDSNDGTRNTTDSLEGTTWTGMNEFGEFIIEFLPQGKLRYTLLSNKRPVGGTWKKIGNVVQVVIGGYSVAEGTMENNIIRLEGSNSEGGKFRMLLTPKAP